MADSVRSLGVSLSVCSIPGQPINPRLDDSTSYELGLGIHGEPGAKSGAMRHAEAGGDGGSGGSSRVVEELIDTLLRNGRLLGSVDGNSGISGAEEAKPRFALLVNNLGAVPPLYISAVAEKAISYLQVFFRHLLEYTILSLSTFVHVPFAVDANVSIGCRVTMGFFVSPSVGL